VSAAVRPLVWGNLVAAMATIIVADIGFGLTYPLLNLLLEERGVDAFVIGLNAAMAPLGILVFGPFIPRLTVRYGGKAMALAAIAGIALSLALFPLFPSIEAWFVIRFLFGAAGVTLYSLSEAWVMQFAPPSIRGRVAAIYASVLSLGFSIGPFMLPFTDIQGFLPFGIAIALVILSTIPLAMVSLDADYGDSDEPHGSLFAFAARAPLLLFAVATLTLFDSVMLAFFPIFAMRSGLDLATASWALGVAVMGNAFFQYPVGWLADRWSRIGVVWVAALVTPLLALSLPFVVNSWLLWPVALLMGSGAYAVYTVALAALGDEFRGQELIAGSVAFGAMWGVGGIAGPPLAGLALDLFGPSGISWVLASFYVLLIAGLAVSGGRLVNSAR
jgi:MFS family permease